MTRRRLLSLSFPLRYVEPEPKKLRLSLQKPRPKSRFERVDEKENQLFARAMSTSQLEGDWGDNSF